MVMDNLRCFNVAGKGVTGVNGVYSQAASGEFPLRLLQ